MTDATITHVLGAGTRDALDALIVKEAARIEGRDAVNPPQDPKLVLLEVGPDQLNLLEMCVEITQQTIQPDMGTEQKLEALMLKIRETRTAHENPYPDALPEGSTVEQYADAIMKCITDDMLKPFPWGKQIPWDVGSFSAVHEYCDANEYVIDVMGAVALNFSDEGDNAIVNTVLDEVSERLEKMATNRDKAVACTCEHAFHEVAPRRGCLFPPCWDKPDPCPCQGFFQNAEKHDG
jgi:hypothetical protein